jgi:hydrogenase maturation protease
MSRTLVIGVGNTIRGDDGVGIRVTERLAERYTGFDILCVHQLSPEHAETIAQYDRLVVVDASVMTDSLRVTPLHGGNDVRLPRTHAVTPAGILALATTLYQRVPSEAILVEIPVSSCDFSEELSAPAAALVEETIDVVAHYLTGS